MTIITLTNRGVPRRIKEERIAAWEPIVTGKDKGKTAIFTDTADLDFVADEDVETVDAIMVEHEIEIEYDDETETANER